MTTNKALELARVGAKIRHNTWCKHQYMTYDGASFVSENGTILNPRLFGDKTGWEECKNVIPDWVEEQCDNLTINGVKYYFRCNLCTVEQKSSHSMNPNLQVQLVIWDDKDRKFLDHKEFKGSYVAEKITDYIRNTINGYRLVYWSNQHERNFDKPKEKKQQ